jgi:Leucine-rich repeat (LRR) protein
VTNLHIVDSFGIEEENDEWNSKLTKIHSFDASELKISNLFKILIQSMPNLIYLHVNSNVLMDCNLKLLLTKNRIKHLELITNNFEQIKDILRYFPFLKQLIINTKNQSNQFKRKSFQIIFDWFHLCSQLYIIHIKANKLSDLIHIDHDETIHIQYSNEILTVWK